jgi:hypothetical protein
MQLLAAHSKNELSISYLFQEELSPLFSPPLQEKENGTLMPKMSVPLASDSSSVQGWAKASKQIEAIKLLRCVLYVRSRATFSIRHPLGAHSVIVRNLFGMCLFFRTLATAKIRTRDNDCQLFATFRTAKTLRQPEKPVAK